MTFGWIMSTPDGGRVDRCAGHCYGRESFLQAEATGMLSASVFMAMIRQSNLNQDKEMRVQYASNNMELGKRGREHQDYMELYKNTTLRAEYDLTEQI